MDYYLSLGTLCMNISLCLIIMYFFGILFFNAPFMLFYFLALFFFLFDTNALF